MKRHQGTKYATIRHANGSKSASRSSFLAKKGINNVQLIPVDIAKREHKSDDYIANINHMGQVPTLELDDGGTANWMGVS